MSGEMKRQKYSIKVERKESERKKGGEKRERRKKERENEKGQTKAEIRPLAMNLRSELNEKESES